MVMRNAAGWPGVGRGGPSGLSRDGGPQPSRARLRCSGGQRQSRRCQREGNNRVYQEPSLWRCVEPCVQPGAGLGVLSECLPTWDVLWCYSMGFTHFSLAITRSYEAVARFCHLPGSKKEFATHTLIDEAKGSAR